MHRAKETKKNIHYHFSNRNKVNQMTSDDKDQIPCGHLTISPSTSSKNLPKHLYVRYNVPTPVILMHKIYSNFLLEDIICCAGAKTRKKKSKNKK